MTEITQINGRPPLQSAQRRSFAQGVVVLSALGPIATYLSYRIAASAGAAAPEAAAGLTAAFCGGGAVIVLSALASRRAYPHARLGLCNLITLMRGAGIAVLAGLVVTPDAALGWWLALFALALLVLDGLDGWVARRERLQSTFGARFDVETDVAFALTLAALAISLGQVGTWFLLLGLLRPLFVAAGWVWSALRAPLPDAKWRKYAAGVQMSVQVLLVSPLLGPPVTSLIGAIVLIVIMGGFAKDIYWLARQARGR